MNVTLLGTGAIGRTSSTASVDMTFRVTLDVGGDTKMKDVIAALNEAVDKIKAATEVIK